MPKLYHYVRLPSSTCPILMFLQQFLFQFLLKPNNSLRWASTHSFIFSGDWCLEQVGRPLGQLQEGNHVFTSISNHIHLPDDIQLFSNGHSGKSNSLPYISLLVAQRYCASSLRLKAKEGQKRLTGAIFKCLEKHPWTSFGLVGPSHLVKPTILSILASSDFRLL